MKKAYILSYDEGYHWDAFSIYTSEEEAVVAWVNYYLNELAYDMVSVKVVERVERDGLITIKILCEDCDSVDFNFHKTVCIALASVEKPEKQIPLTYEQHEKTSD